MGKRLEKISQDRLGIFSSVIALSSRETATCRGVSATEVSHGSRFAFR